MFCTASPTADYERYADALEAQSEAFESHQTQAADEIREILTRTVHAVDPAHLTLPIATHDGRIARNPLPEAVTDMINDAPVLAAFLRVLHYSVCPDVESLRKALADRYVEQHADAIGQVMSGDDL